MESQKPSINALYDSAPTSPTLTNRSVNTMWFYSLPSSPNTGVSKSPYNVPTDPRIPRTYYEDVNSNFDEFEFETSRRIEEHSLDHHEHQGHHGGGSLPVMAFADDLFCEGKVLPLKLPPRLRTSNGTISSSTPTSPKSSFNSIIKSRSLWNDDFDPFMVALENVREGEKGGKSGKKSYRRAQSMTPMLPTKPKPPNGPVYELNVAEPRGVVYGRQARQLAKGEGDEKPSRANGADGKQSKKKKIMKLIKKSLSMEKAAKPKMTKQCGFVSMGLVECNVNKRIPGDVTRMTMVQCRPKLLLCMANPLKYAN